MTAGSFEESYAGHRVDWEHIVANRQQLSEALSRHHFVSFGWTSDLPAERYRADFNDGHGFYALRVMLLRWDGQNAEIEAVPIYVWADGDAVVTFVPEPLGAIGRVREKLAYHPDWANASVRLVYYLLDELLADVFLFLDNVNDRIAALEEDVMQMRQSVAVERRIFRFKREVLKARRTLASMRDVVSQLVRYWTTRVQQDSFYYMELYDHMIRQFDTIDTYRELVNSVLDLHFSTVSTRLNEIVKTLTLATTVLLPASVVAALYGMNFDYLPLRHYRWGFLVVLGVVGAISLGLYTVFRRRRWV